MDTQDVITPKAVDGHWLIQQLEALDGLTNPSPSVFDAQSEDAMNRAIRLLRESGFYASKITMVEGDFYLLEFMPIWDVYPHMEHWPYWVRLRLLTNGMTLIPLALAYRTEVGYERFTGSYQSTAGTQSSDAEKMLFHFRGEHPNKEPIWMPLFAGQPALF